jgi:hypothetical protein
MGAPAAIYSVSKERFVGSVHPNGLALRVISLRGSS